jgi:hypothetical protein
MRPLLQPGSTAGALFSNLSLCPFLDRFENQFSSDRDCRLQAAINRALVREDPVRANGSFPMSLVGPQLQTHVNAPDHEHIVLQLNFTDSFAH